jgi:hypothetical protein
MKINDIITEANDGTQDEIFHFGNKSWDVKKGYQLAKKHNIQPEMLPVEGGLASFLGFVRVNKDWVKTTDITKPVLLIDTGKGVLVIDGYHRISLAKEQGVQEMPGYILSPEQSKEIQVGINEDWEQDPGYDYENPLPHSNDEWIWHFMEEIEDEYKEHYGANMRPKDIADKYGKVMNVPLSNIIATEKWLKRDQIESIMNNSATSSSELPIFYYEDGKYVVGDGNHRIVAAYLNKESSIKGRVLALEFLNED